jgi:hypothetical protein
MITNATSRIFEGVVNNLVSKISGYPTVTLLRNFKHDVAYIIDLKSKNLSPDLDLNSTDLNLLNRLFDWFYKELGTRKIEESDI